MLMTSARPERKPPPPRIETRPSRPSHFTLDDALAKVGRQVRVIAPVPDVALQTIGTVIAVSGGNDRAMVLVEWSGWRPFTNARQTTPLGRWFSRPEYDQSLVEI